MPRLVLDMLARARSVLETVLGGHCMSGLARLKNIAQSVSHPSLSDCASRETAEDENRR